MKILVCIKEVPDLDPEAELTIDDETMWLVEDDSMRYGMNRFDEFAVEEALQFKEAVAECQVDVVTAGPNRSHAVIRRALGMGADHGIHIIVETAGAMDPCAVSSYIAYVAKERQYDLVLTGVMSEDLQQGVTGVMIAKHLDMPWASAVIDAEHSDEQDQLTVEREIEGGMRDRLRIQLPCVLTIQSGINQPRYPALSKVLKAKKAELENYHASELCDSRGKQMVHSISYPKKERAGQVLTGTAKEKAKSLIALLREKSLLE